MDNKNITPWLAVGSEVVSEEKEVTKAQAVEAMVASGLENVRGNGGVEISFQCPDPKHVDRRASASLNFKKGVWCCYGCGAKGSMGGLLGLPYLKRKRAAEVIAAKLARRDRKGVKVQLPADFKRLRKPNNYLKFRSIDEEAIKVWRIGVAGDYVVFPAYMSRRLRGWQGRAMTPGREPRYESAHGVGDYVLGFDIARKMRRRTIAVVEGPFDAIRVWQAGFPVVALLGGGSARRASLLLKLKRDLVVLPDKDDGGDVMVERVIALAASRKVHLAKLPSGRSDPGECTTAELRRALRKF